MYEYSGAEFVLFPVSGGGKVGIQAEAGEGDAGLPQEAEAGGAVLRAEVR